MLVVAEIAIDREPQELISGFVKPLNTILQEGRLGRVTDHRTLGLLTVKVKMTVSSSEGYERILQFFGEADAPLGTIVYQVGWFGRKKEIVMLGP